MKVRLNKQILQDARILTGLCGQMHFCYGDIYFAQSCKNKYGEQAFNVACQFVLEQAKTKEKL